MKNNFTKNYTFSCPIYKIRIDPNSYDKEKILNDIKYNKNLKNTRNDTQYNFDNCDIHHSYRDFDNEDFRKINYDKLIAVYQEIFQNFVNKEITTVKKINWGFNIVNYSAVTEGQYLPTHNHIECNFSTIHYLNLNDDHVPTRFHNPSTFAPFLKMLHVSFSEILDNRDTDNSYFFERIMFPVKTDDLLIFPGALKHEIPIQGPTKEPRITISSNIKILSQEEKDEGWTR